MGICVAADADVTVKVKRMVAATDRRRMIVVGMKRVANLLRIGAVFRFHFRPGASHKGNRSKLTT